MDQATATFWLDVIAGGAAALWLLGAVFVVRTRQLLATPTHGERTLTVRGETVLATVGKLLTMAPLGHPLQRARIESATDRELRWRSTGPFAHTAVLQARPNGSGCTVHSEVTSSSWMVPVGLAVAALGAVVTATLWYLLGTHVVGSEHAEVRMQAVQMAQASHLLWPPFLFAGVARLCRRRVIGEIDRVLQNLVAARTGA
jgi:hypothetical protein